jgi:hypothetical protein
MKIRVKNQESRIKNRGDICVQRIFLSCVLALMSCVLLESATSFNLISTYQTQANTVAVDNFSNFYTAADNNIYKYSSDGGYLYPYEEFSYGKIGMIDVSNPMKILVFYPDFLTVITLDKFLAPLSTYNFFALGYQNVSAVASSIDGRLWFYDNTTFQLKKIDETGNIYQQSQPLNSVTDAVPNPTFMLEKDNALYMNDPAIGILVFDFFGNYNKTIPIKGLTKFQIFQDQIIYFDDKKMNAYNMTTFDLKRLTLPDSLEVVGAAIQKDRLAILKKDHVDFYRY